MTLECGKKCKEYTAELERRRILVLAAMFFLFLIYVVVRIITIQNGVQTDAQIRGEQLKAIQVEVQIRGEQLKEIQETVKEVKKAVAPGTDEGIK